MEGAGPQDMQRDISPGWRPATSAVSAAAVGIGLPSMATMTSLGRSPAALAAEQGATWLHQRATHPDVMMALGSKPRPGRTIHDARGRIAPTAAAKPPALATLPRKYPRPTAFERRVSSLLQSLKRCGGARASAPAASPQEDRVTVSSPSLAQLQAKVIVTMPDWWLDCADRHHVGRPVAGLASIRSSAPWTVISVLNQK